MPPLFLSSVHIDVMSFCPALARSCANQDGVSWQAMWPHWQVSLIIIGQVAHRGTKSLLTLMVHVQAGAYNFFQKICFFLEPLPKEQKRKTEFPQGTLKETYKDFLDRWSLKLITSICGLQVQTNACMASQWAEIIISQWGHYWQQEDPSAETPDTPHWTKTPVWGNLHDLLWRYPWKYYSVSSTCIHLI